MPGLIRLRAEMLLPGTAWVEWHIEPAGTGSRPTQRAVVAPRGLFGRAYSYPLLPFHALIVDRMALRLADGANVNGGETPKLFSFVALNGQVTEYSQSLTTGERGQVRP